MLVVALNDHTHSAVFFVVVILFLLVLLQQVFCKKPANQIIISTYNKVLYKMTTLTTQCFLLLLFIFIGVITTSIL